MPSIFNGPIEYRVLGPLAQRALFLILAVPCGTAKIVAIGPWGPI